MPRQLDYNGIRASLQQMDCAPFLCACEEPFVKAQSTVWVALTLQTVYCCLLVFLQNSAFVFVRVCVQQQPQHIGKLQSLSSPHSTLSLLAWRS